MGDEAMRREVVNNKERGGERASNVGSQRCEVKEVKSDERGVRCEESVGDSEERVL